MDSTVIEEIANQLGMAVGLVSLLREYGRWS